MTETVTLNGNTYDDSSSGPNRYMGNGGHRANLIRMLSDAVVDLAAKQSAAAGSASSASTSATSAGASATEAASSAASAVAAPGTSATSITSLTVGIGSKTLTIQTGKSIVVGMSVKIADTSTPTNWMFGDVTSYNGGTGSLTVNVTVTNGSGTIAAWTVSLSGARGAAGADGGITNIVTATSNTTLTSTPTLLVITPAAFGVTVALPDATSITPREMLHAVDNQGGYPVRIVDSTGTLKGFVLPRTKTLVGLSAASAAGTWSFTNAVSASVSGQLATTRFGATTNAGGGCIDLGANREIILGIDASSNIYAVVFDRSTGQFGSVAAVRTNASINSNSFAACLAGTDKVLVVSASATAFEAAVLSITGSSIAVGTAQTATLSSNISNFTINCGLMAVGSSFACLYFVGSGEFQIRALTVTGTTPAIGNATTLDGTAANTGFMFAASDKLVTASFHSGTNTLYTKPYTVSGTTISPGTGTSTSTSGTIALNKFCALGSDWAMLYYDNNLTAIRGAIISLSGTTTAISFATLFSGAGFALTDAIVVGSNKICVFDDQTTNNVNILTDTAGTASAGSAITGDSTSSRVAVYASGNTVVYAANQTTFVSVDCSGSSPASATILANGGLANTEHGVFSASDTAMRRSVNAAYGAAYARTHVITNSTNNFGLEVKNGRVRKVTDHVLDHTATGGFTLGRNDAERWSMNAYNFLTKLECVA